MNYKVNEFIYIRKELINKEYIYFFFVVSNDKMYRLNEDAYLCYMYVKENLSKEDIVLKFKEKYPEDNLEEIEKTLETILQYFIDVEILFEENI